MEEDGYHLDSVSVVLDNARGGGAAAAHESGYAAAVSRLEERVKHLGRQLAAEREQRERLEREATDPFRVCPRTASAFLLSSGSCLCVRCVCCRCP